MCCCCAPLFPLQFGYICLKGLPFCCILQLWHLSKNKHFSSSFPLTLAVFFISRKKIQQTVGEMRFSLCFFLSDASPTAHAANTNWMLVNLMLELMWHSAEHNKFFCLIFQCNPFWGCSCVSDAIIVLVVSRKSSFCFLHCCWNQQMNCCFHRQLLESFVDAMAFAWALTDTVLSASAQSALFCQICKKNAILHSKQPIHWWLLNRSSDVCFENACLFPSSASQTSARQNCNCQNGMKFWAVSNRKNSICEAACCSLTCSPIQLQFSFGSPEPEGWESAVLLAALQLW